MRVPGACSERACFYIFFFAHTAGRKTRRERERPRNFRPWSVACCCLRLRFCLFTKNYPSAHIERNRKKD